MTLLTVVSIIFGVYGTVMGLRKDRKAEDKADASEMATITAKLETISNNTLEIKTEIKSIKEETRKNSDEIIRISESLKSAWKRINNIEGIKYDGDDGK